MGELKQDPKADMQMHEGKQFLRPAPSNPGALLAQIRTPSPVVDLDAFDRNLERMRLFAERTGMVLRPHAKTHKSADVARAQMARGGAVGVCCQKVSEAEALAAGGVVDILVANEVTEPEKLGRLAELAAKVRMQVCVDDPDAVDLLSTAMAKAGEEIGVLVEIDCGAGRCGIRHGEPAAELAAQVAAAPGLRFDGLQAYQGSAQHMRTPAERKAAVDAAAQMARESIAAIEARGLTCAVVTGAGTGTFPLEAASGVYTELQCGSYVFMDADYARNLDEQGGPALGFEQSLFVLTSIMSVAGAAHAVCDAGHKAASVDSGLPLVADRPDLAYKGPSDEHGIIQDPRKTLRLNDRLKLIPGHCDPTVNLHDWLIGVRNDRVETIWPVSARGCGF